VQQRLEPILHSKRDTCCIFSQGGRTTQSCCCWCFLLVLFQVLDDFQTDPRAARKHLQNPDIHKKISKLVSAGIIQLR
jgi:hypothetical protein